MVCDIRRIFYMEPRYPCVGAISRAVSNAGTDAEPSELEVTRVIISLKIFR
jgi:hypothetical protein